MASQCLTLHGKYIKSSFLIKTYKYFFLNEIIILYRYANGEEIPKEGTKTKRTLTSKKIEDNLLECTVTLSVPDVQQADTGNYAVKAVNTYGEAEAHVSIFKLFSAF